MSNILVTDAVSLLGHAVVEHLVNQPQGNTIIAFVHNLVMDTDFTLAGATLRGGDYNDYSSLVAAFQGVDKLYYVSGNDPYSRCGNFFDSDAQHENVVRAALEAGVKHVFYTSYQRKVDNPHSSLHFQAAGHLYAERQLHESGLSYTLLKHALYTDLLPELIGESVLQTNTIFLPAGEGRISSATVQDIALAGAKLLLQTEPVAQSYELSGLESYSLADVAAILSELTGKPIQYVSPTADEFMQELSDSAEPAEYTYSTLGLCQVIKRGEFDCINPTLTQLLGREPESIKSYLKQYFNL